MEQLLSLISISFPGRLGEIVHHDLTRGIFCLFGEKLGNDFLDADIDGRLNDREAAELIKVLCQLAAATDFSRLPGEMQSQYLHRLQQERCSIRQLARLTGLTKGQVERLLK